MASETTCLNAIRCLGAALPQAAKSGHPGAPMGCAAIAHALYGKVMRFSPKHPEWVARDRFVLSNGHGCALQYTMLYLLGYDVSQDDLRQFRQLHSKCPGHPESFQTPGVEVTTGPLGQGVAQAVGLAMAAESMAAQYNRPDFPLFDPFIYTIVGDGCLQEGVSAEASSLAGHLGLGRLIVYYDDNGITIDGKTELSFSEDVAARYRAYGWQVLRVQVADCNVEGILRATEEAKQNRSQPTLIVCPTTIGFGSVVQGTEKAHGSPLGEAEVLRLRREWGIGSGDASDDMLSVPDAVLQFYRNRGATGDERYAAWETLFKAYAAAYPKEHAELTARLENRLPEGWLAQLPQYTPEDKGEATRALSGKALNALAAIFPSLVGGSADLTGSNSSGLKGIDDFSAKNRLGRYFRYGVREHGMAAITNGIFAFGGFRPFAATFLNFITYAWGAVRLSALSRFGILFIATHDSIELGEDGPTHQPVELAALCRATPNLHYFRPADGNEVSGAYASWMQRKDCPTVLALCRSAVPHLPHTCAAKAAAHGAYILSDFTGSGRQRLILAGCGSELHLCVEAARRLSACKENPVDVRVVSMPCWDIFEEQTAEYKASVLPRDIPSLYVEAAVVLGAEKYFNKTVGMHSFGASAPKAHVWKEFGFTSDNIEAVARTLL